VGPTFLGLIMAINKSDYTNKVDTGLKADKTFTYFYYRFKIDGKEFSKTFDYSTKRWDVKTKKSKAKQDALNFKESKHNDLKNITIGFDDKTTLNQMAKAYFETDCDKSSEWTLHRKRVYELYIENNIGKKPVRSIKVHDINTLRASMEEKGHSKQTQNGCSPRTIKKVLIQTLKPIMQYALDNGIIDKIPRIDIGRHNDRTMKKGTKKVVTEGSMKLAVLYKTIAELYEDNPFYRTLFLFALYGRRWNEIRTLRWSDIDVLDNRYTIRAENNKIRENQTYDLPEPIKLALFEMKDDQKGIVFKSPVTGHELHVPKKQLAKIRELANIPELTMHYFRHILVSAMGEMGTATTVLSASLGHTNLKTVNDFYLSANHTKGSQEANKMIGSIVSDSK